MENSEHRDNTSQRMPVNTHLGGCNARLFMCSYQPGSCRKQGAHTQGDTLKNLLMKGLFTEGEKERENLKKNINQEQWEANQY